MKDAKGRILLIGESYLLGRGSAEEVVIDVE
jgi:hypothetical protein